jgi:hypothetical protein
MAQGMGLPGMLVEIGAPVSTDGGLLFVVRRLVQAQWFHRLVGGVHAAIVGYPNANYGYAREEKLRRGLLALIAGMAMGYRSVNAIADVINADPLWRRTLGKRISQPDLSRLMELLSEVGIFALRRAVAESSAEGRSGLNIDGDSSLIEVHGKQEDAAYNGHYHGHGFHAGWMVDTDAGKVIALWLNPGNAYTSEGQASMLKMLSDMGLKVNSYRGDAGMPNPETFDRLDKDGAIYTMRLKSNARLDKLAERLLPAGPWQAGQMFMGEFEYAAKSWDRERRVVAKLQKPKAEHGAVSLFWEGFYFVTNRQAPATDIVKHYLQRGQAEQVFGEFLQVMTPNFRHEERVKNEAWAQILALGFNTLVDLRIALPREGAIRKVLKITQDLTDPGFVAIALERAKAFATASLVMFRAHALKLFNVFVSHARGEKLRIHPTMLRPGWPSNLLEAAHAPIE